MWNPAKWFALLLPVLALAPEVHARSTEITCKSFDYKYNYCRAKTEGHVRLVKKLSNARCERGRSWGYDRNGVWVNRGCQARFRVGRGGHHGSAPSGRTITCRSKDYQYRHCSANTRGGVRLVERLDHSKCQRGRTWGYDGRGVWVDDGCQGRFELGRGGGGGPSHGPGHGGGSGARQVTCRSRNWGYHHCRMDTRNGARLVRRLAGRCRRGESWGVDRRGVWVDRGCAARFASGGGGGWHNGGHGGGGWGGGGYAGSDKVDCRSKEYRYRHCKMNTRNGVRLVKRYDHSDCRRGYSWGYDRRGVWVDHGCQGRFESGYGDHDNGWQEHGSNNHHNNKDDDDGISTGALAVGAAAGAALLAAIVANSSGGDDGGGDNSAATAPPSGPPGGAGPSGDSRPPAWAIGTFRGHNAKYGLDVEMTIHADGTVVSRVKGQEYRSRFVDGRIVAGETVFKLTASQDGFRAAQVGVPDNVVYYRRVH